MVGKVTPNNMLSASVIPALMNASPWTTPNDLLGRIIAVEEGTFKDDFKQNEAMFWGDTMEATILLVASQRLGLTEYKFDYDEAFFHDELPLACSLDGSGIGTGIVRTDTSKGIYCINAEEIDTSTRGVLEAKNTGNKPESAPAPFRGPLQLQAQMMCTGAQWGAVCVLYGGNELRVFVYKASDETQAAIAEAVLDFEERKKNKDWYPLASSDDGNVAYARVDDGAPPLDLEGKQELSYLEELVAAKQQKKIAEQQIAEAEAGLKEFMGSHEQATGTVGNTLYRVSWPMRTRKASPEKIIPAKPEERVRQNTLTLKEISQ
jgi:hypothetical protein